MQKFNNRVKILLEVDGKNKAFYWFECKGEDIYWGHSRKASKSWSTDFSGIDVEINIATWNEATFKSAKSSYHESGEFHIKLIDNNNKSKYNYPMTWRKKDAISDPFRIMALFSMAPIHYDDYKRSPTRKGSKAVIIKCTEESKKTRKYVEFYI